MKQLDSDMNIRTKEDSSRHYSVPDDYFASFTDKLMAQIPTEEVQEEQAPPKRLLWHRLRPVLYVAASFLLMLGVYQAFNLFGTGADNNIALPTSTSLVASDYGDSRWSEDSDYSDFLHENSVETAADELVLTNFSE